MVWNDENLTRILKQGGVVVMPTDTLYGIVGIADSVETVNRIYNVRKRNPDKPCIILIGGVSELEKFSVTVSKEQKEILTQNWPGPVSIILDCEEEKFKYLHRGTKTLAFRLPASEDLQNLLKKTGPLIAPSANLEGFPPAQNISEAKKYFGDLVDLYVDGGEAKGNPSRVIKLKKDGAVEVLRP
jgi:L-threonylcarbamoyladenylate synthase